MEDDYFNRRRPAAPGVSLRAVLGTSLLAFIGGAGLIGWLAYDGKLQFGDDFARPAASAPARLANTSPSPAAAPSPSLAAATGGMEDRIASLEERIARLDLQTTASEGNSARAEALLIALAVRRAIERGAPLGQLEDQLKLRFGDAQANSVALLVDTAKRPVTVAQLSSDLETLAPALLGTPPNEGGWERFTRELSGLFVIRRGDTASVRPDARLDRARLMLRSGQVDGALAEVEGLPGASVAGDWINAARRYAAAQKALDLLETTALLEIDRLKSATGAPVQQPGPAVAPINSEDF